MFRDSSENELLDPPAYDLLTVRFRGDDHEMTLPYCEVLYGHVLSISIAEHFFGKIADVIEAVGLVDADRELSAKIAFEAFTALVEETFDTKEIVKLQLQKAGSYEVYNIKS